MLGQCQGLGLSLSSMGISQNPTLGSNLLLAQNASGIRGSISRMNVIAGTGEIILVEIGTGIFLTFFKLLVFLNQYFVSCYTTVQDSHSIKFADS